MGSTASDTQREIGALRADMSSAIAELESRVRGGFRGIAGAEARVSTGRAGESVAQKAEQYAGLLTVAGTVAVAAVGYSIYEGIDRWRESRKPQNRLKRRVGDLGDEVATRARSVRGEVETRVRDSRKRVEKARKEGVLLKVEREGDEYLRVKEARLDIPKGKEGKRTDVLKNLLWAAVLSIFMAGAGVAARRGAGALWRATLREDPPTQKK
ncbi:MAG: hypothetical protein HYX52_02615 [Chloroflexi bacterium]|nr:hypothetical protein [Chloroflexota bacterium]